MTDLKAAVVIDLKGNLPQQSQRFQRSVQDMAEGGSRKLAIMGRGIATVSNQIDRLGNRTALLAIGIGGFLGRELVNTAAKFEKFRAILETLEGSSQKAQEDLNWIQEFAAKTPYEIDEVTDAFVRLKSYGMDPMKGNLLRTLGDTASGMGKGFDQAVEAIADAVTGENERLKEFGIKARVTGNKMVYEYTVNGKTMTKKAKANSREQIAATLSAIWNEKYQGAMDKQSRTWLGMTSNLKDSWTQFEVKVMQSGAFDYLKGEIDGLLQEINRLQQNGQLDQSARVISQELVTGLRSAKEMAGGLWVVMKQIGSAAKFVADQVGGFENLAKALAYLYVGNKALRLGVGAAKVGGGIVQAAGVLLGGKAGKVAGALGAATATPVFVTNWPGSVPSGGMPGVGGALPNVPGKLPSDGKVITSTWRLLKNLTPAQISALGASAIGTSAALVGAAGAAGYGAGTVIRKGMETFTPAAYDTLGGILAQALANLGNKSAAQAIDTRMNYESTVRLEISGDAAHQVRVLKRDKNTDVITSGKVMGTH